METLFKKYFIQFFFFLVFGTAKNKNQQKNDFCDQQKTSQKRRETVSVIHLCPRSLHDSISLGDIP